MKLKPLKFDIVTPNKNNKRRRNIEYFRAPSKDGHLVQSRRHSRCKQFALDIGEIKMNQRSEKKDFTHRVVVLLIQQIIKCRSIGWNYN